MEASLNFPYEILALNVPPGKNETWKDEKRERETRPQLLDCHKKCPHSSRNGAHLSLLAARFRSLTVKCRKEAARETEADPLPMTALDFAGLVRTTKRTVDASHKNCTPDGVFLSLDISEMNFQEN